MPAASAERRARSGNRRRAVASMSGSGSTPMAAAPRPSNRAIVEGWPVEYTIGQLADRFGLATHVLRHWEDMGVLSPVRRTAGRRVYGPVHVARIAEILLC